MRQYRKSVMQPAIGLIVSLLFGIIGIMILSALVLNNTIPEKALRGAIWLLMFTSSVIGGIVSIRSDDTPGYMTVVGACAYYMVILVCGLLFFDGVLHTPLLTGISIISGGLVACMAQRKKGRKQRRRRS